MTSPKRAFDTDYGRFYRHPKAGKPKSALGSMLPMVEGPNSPKPSITNITKMMDEGFLPGYHGKLIAEYAATNIGDLVHMDESELIKTLRAVPDTPHPNAAIGTNVHAMIDALHKGEEIPEGETITARRMFAQYQHFVEVADIKVIRTEFTVWNYDVGYAGTGDMAWMYKGIPWIVDFKSGNSVYPKVAMQCAAIMHADTILEDDDSETEMFNAAAIGVVHVRPMSIKFYELDRVEESWQAFKACKRLFDWMRFDKEFVVPTEPILKTVRPK